MKTSKEYYYRKSRVWTEVILLGSLSWLSSELIFKEGAALLTSWWTIPIIILVIAVLLFFINYSYVLRASFSIQDEHLVLRKLWQKSNIPLSDIRRISVRDQPGLFNKKHRVMRISLNAMPMLTIQLSDLEDPATFLNEINKVVQDHQISMIYQNKDGQTKASGLA